ncbi:uracil-DNA glycosylase [Acrocarpospora corrugata]|uniref:uracil-DNA glycosylase n=1 Tax=Acrocarpospora corrugata TaxID=35763 RepID=UPI0012D2DCC9|nr:uracil-DNA glycosylase [Acrocarpospora corrugata]
MSCVPPGTGWPDDPASADTPVAHDPREVAGLAGGSRTLAELVARESVCRACPRLVAWREEVAEVKRKAFAGETYWGRPIAGWGEEDPQVLIVGLAPAAHGGNRTGRVFTGDRSGDWLFRALYRVGLAVQETSTHAGDGQRLLGARVVAAVRCAPPANKPTPEERDTCAPWLVRELQLTRPKAIVVLGGFAWQALWPALRSAGYPLPRARPAFGHGVEVPVGDAVLLGCYHPSQQNTFTGRVTAEMLETIFKRALELSS